MRHLFHRTRLLLLCSLVLLLALISARSVFAASQGFYPTKEGIREAMLVSLTANPEFVEPASLDNAERLVGLVGAGVPEDLIDPDKIVIQTDGTVNALVSTINGDIAVGDAIGVSPLEGVGSKNSGEGWAVGIAQAGFNGLSENAVKTKVNDSSGQEREVFVGTVPVFIKIVNNSDNSSAASESAAQTDAVMPEVIQKIADSLAGKRVSTRALLLSFVLFLVGVVASVIIVNSAIRSGFMAVSRQPLSRKAIIREEIRSFAFAFAVLVVTLITSFTILRIL